MSDKAPPIQCVFVDGVFKPARPAMELRAKHHYGEGELVDLVRHDERSLNSHQHFFASVNEAWRSLPDELVDRWPSAEALRKWCLIKTGFCDMTTTVFANRADAQKAAALLIPLDEFAVVDVRDNVLIRSVAQSQSFRAMGKEKFQRSKNAVLEEIARILGATPAEIEDAARSAA